MQTHAAFAKQPSTASLSRDQRDVVDWDLDDYIEAARSAQNWNRQDLSSAFARSKRRYRSAAAAAVAALAASSCSSATPPANASRRDASAGGERAGDAGATLISAADAAAQSARASGLRDSSAQERAAAAAAFTAGASGVKSNAAQNRLVAGIDAALIAKLDAAFPRRRVPTTMRRSPSSSEVQEAAADASGADYPAEGDGRHDRDHDGAGDDEETEALFEESAAAAAAATKTGSMHPKTIVGRHVNGRRGWSDEENRVLLEKYRELGPRWPDIARHLPGRTEFACRDRLNRILGVK